MNKRKICSNCNSNHTHFTKAYLLDEISYALKYQCKKCLFEWEEKQLLNVESKTYKYICIEEKGEKRSVGLHRWVWEQYNNETLKPGEEIHHINWKKWDNRPKNLLKVQNQYEHLKLDPRPKLIEKIKEYEKKIKELEAILKDKYGYSST